jgi:ABC-type oligopeptide transport system ATPase subunit
VVERTVDHVRAVDDVSFEIREGETLGLVGESGSGKSTTGYCVLQLLKPTGGTVRFEGRELTTMGREDLRKTRRDMQIVFQDPYASLNPRMTVGNIVGEPLRGPRDRRPREPQGDRPATAATSSASIPATSTATRTSSRAASGSGSASRARSRSSRADRLRRAGVGARRLDPGADPEPAQDLQRDFGLTYLFIAHDLAVVRTMSDRIAVMNRGKIVEMGPAAEVYARPKDDYTKALLAAVPVPDPRLMRERKLERRKLRHALAEPI